MNFGEAIPIPLDTADGSKVGRDDLTPPCKIGLKCIDFKFFFLDDPHHEMNTFEFAAILVWFCKNNLKGFGRIRICQN